MKWHFTFPKRLPPELLQAEITEWQEQEAGQEIAYHTTYGGLRSTLSVRGFSSESFFTLIVQNDESVKTYKFDDLPEKWKVLPTEQFTSRTISTHQP